ncbi:hypothetical protein EYC58_00685 [Candidatus Saccharibacteria bacterium]|nr:MAG: hypothetical protein EYC58_00685 [Candidatus Saccharibacteria bacterium]
MKRLVIAIDCDDVLVSGTEHVISSYNKTYGTQVRIEHAHQSDNPEWETDRDEVFRRIHAIQQSDEYALITPDQETIQVVEALAGQHDLYVVSARHRKVLGVTQTMLDRYFPGCFKGIEHVGDERTKGEVCDQLGAQVMIDDNIKNLLSAQEAGVEKLIWYGDYPWQNYDEWAEGVSRCLSWGDIKREIDELARQ